MIQWLIVGLVIWYFYNRYRKQNRIRHHEDPRYIRDDDFQSRQSHRTQKPEDEDDYIDYEEVQ